MLTKKLAGTALCIMTTGWSALSLYGETIVLPEPLPEHCANGNCVPRRVTNGFYPTRWRKWPIEPPMAPKRGVREGIAAPPVELPDPETEGDLPKGAITEPPPPDDSATAPGAAAPRRGGPTAPPPGRQPPRTAPEPGLPPELLNEAPLPSFEDNIPQIPSNDRPPRRMSGLAARSGSRPEAVLESLRMEADRSAHDDKPASRIPGILPADEIDAEPLPKVLPAGRRTSHEELAPAERAVTWRPQSAWTAADTVEEASSTALESAEMADVSDSQTTRMQQDDAVRSHPRLSSLQRLDRETGELSALAFKDIDKTAAEPSSLAFSAGLNTAASLRSKSTATESMSRASGVVELSIAAPAPAGATLRSVSPATWNGDIAIKNPLRGSSTAARVVVETDDQPDDLKFPESAREVPKNPLRAR